MPADKEFKTVYDQIRLLKKRKLKINNLNESKKHLIEKNYFNLINGFETLLLEDAKNPPKEYFEKSFNDFVKLYDFDLDFSTILFKKISEFETKLKTTIAYNFCKNHCTTLADNDAYIDIKNYSIPKITEGPKEYVSFFYNQRKPRNSHRLFRNDYYFEGNFRGNFTGKVEYLGGKTKLTGNFNGRFGSTSIREVKGSLSFLNSKQSNLFSSLQSLQPSSGGSITAFQINVSEERIYGLSYIDDCKIKYPYINEYNNPPFWVVIRTLMFNDLIILLYGLKKRTFEAVLKEFGLKPQDREKFLNSLEIIKELRNTCAHFELVNRFRTSQRLKINAHLISELKLQPMRSQYVIKLYDVLKVLNLYIDLSDVKIFLLEYWYKVEEADNTDIATSLLDRMGNDKIENWI